MTRWEFTTVTVRSGHWPGFGAVEDHGKLGWQIAGVESGGEYTTHFYMQRPVDMGQRRPPAKPPRRLPPPVSE